MRAVADTAQPLRHDRHRAVSGEEARTQEPGATVAARHAFASAHTVVGVVGGRIVSLIDPPARYERAAAGCVNRGCFPSPPASPDSKSRP